MNQEMMKNAIGIDSIQSEQLVHSLNDLLANYAVFYQNLRGFHWNITGAAFFELPAKFEELYTGANLAIDEIAERILTLGGKPLHSFTSFIESSDISEAKDANDAQSTVGTSISNLAVLLSKERAIMKLASSADDEGTMDLMSTYISNQEKTVWMLKAYLK
jgi:starvation-inducible DNA-binding protein